MIAAAGHERVTELLVDCGLGAIVLAGAMYFLMVLFRRGRGDDGPPRPPPRW